MPKAKLARKPEEEQIVRDEIAAQKAFEREQAKANATTTESTSATVVHDAGPSPEHVAALGVLAEFESLLQSGNPVTPAYLRKATDTLRAALEPQTS